ncbi:MAG: glycosyltransferase family 4 protein [Pirellulales bacterium]
MKVLFVNYLDFEGTSGIHVFHLLNALEEQGVDCTVAVPNRPESVSCFGTPKFKAISYNQAIEELAPSGDLDLVHSWGPREITRRLSLSVAKKAGIPYVVHIEDNEENITARFLGVEPQKMSWWHLLKLAQNKRSINVSHPRRYKEFMANALGITSTWHKLEEFSPPGKEFLAFWPSCEPEFFDISYTPYPELRKQYHVSPEEMVICYAGNVHIVNREEIATLYEAVPLARAQGLPLKLVRSGIGDQLLPKELTDMAEKGWVVNAGYLAGAEMVQFMQLTDVHVQPGKPGPYNDYRFPSKLPMYLASGRPVIMPDSNLAEFLTDKKHCIIMQKGDAAELVEHLMTLHESKELRESLARNGREFARQNFSWDKSATEVIAFYRRLLNRQR